MFCKSPCLEKLVADDGESLQCPTCRHLVPLPANGVSGLQSDFHIDHMFEIRDAFNKPAESTAKECGNCEEQSATGYCHDCEQSICDECQAAHRTLKITKNHQIITLDEFHAQATNLIPRKKAVPRCPKHSNKKLKIYCETCQELICSDCTIKLHQGHNYDLVADVFSKNKDEIVSSLTPIKEKLDKVQQALQAFDTRAREISDHRITVEANIHKQIDQQHQFLDEQRVVLVTKLDMHTQQKLKSLSTQKDQTENIQVKLSSCLEYATGGLETGTEGEVLAMKAQVLKRIEQINGEFVLATIQPETKADIRLLSDGKQQFQDGFRECFEIVDGESVSAENSQIDVDSLTGAEVNKTATVDVRVMTNDNKSYNGRVDVTAEITHFNSQSTTKYEVEKKDDKHKVSYQPRNRGRHELHIAVNGRQMKGSPFDVAVSPSLQSLGKPTRVIKDLKKPWGITTNSNSHFIVTEHSGNQVSLFSSDFQKIRSFGSKGTGQGQFNSPAGIAVDGDDNIYVTEYCNHRIQKFTANGDFQSSVGKQGTEDLQFNTPCEIGYNKANGKLYVCDQYNHRVQVLNTDLTFHTSFGNKGKSSQILKFPVGACFDTHGNVYIAEYGNNRVQAYTAEGEYLRNFGRGQLNGPLDVAISSSGVMYIAEVTANRVSMFTATGKFIRSFGKKGTREGQFEAPVTIIIDDDTNIIVTDKDNDRIQVF